MILVTIRVLLLILKAGFVMGYFYSVVLHYILIPPLAHCTHIEINTGEGI